MGDTRDTRILIVEDDPNTASYLYNQLVSMGYKRIDFAVKAAEAIQITKKSAPDLIFMDLFLRGSMNGIDTAREILKNAKIPIIYMSGSSNFYLVDQAGFREQPGLLTKPFTLEDIRSSMKDINSIILKETAEFREAERLKALDRYSIVDTPREKTFDTIASTAAKIFDVPIAVVTFVDRDKIWFKSKYGFPKNHIPKRTDLFANAFLPDTFHHSNNKSPECDLNPLFSNEYQVEFYACAPLLTQDGYPLGTLCVMDSKPRGITSAERDILTNLASLVMDHMEMRKVTRNAYKLQRNFVSTAVHNLKNPLTSVLGFSDILEKGLTGKQLDFNKHIKQSAQNMLEIVDHLLQTSLLELEQVKLNRIPIRFSEVLDSAVASSKIQAFKKKQTLEIRISGNPVVNVDAIKLGEALDNLISNAVKYSPAEIPIKISAEQKGGTVHFEIKDEGPGISEEKIKTIFEKFSEQDARPTAGEGSTGLGLAIAKNLVELHGGKISARSKGLGKGSTFIIELPAASISELENYENPARLEVEAK